MKNSISQKQNMTFPVFFLIFKGPSVHPFQWKPLLSVGAIVFIYFAAFKDPLISITKFSDFNIKVTESGAIIQRCSEK